MSLSYYTKEIVGELRTALSHVDDRAGDALAEATLQADRVFVCGAGRSLLMIRTLAMRLMQLGKPAYVVGETVTPAIRQGDLLVVGSGSGETAALALMAKKAKSLGAELALITILPDSTIGKLADHVIAVDAPSSKLKENGGRTSVQPGGSLFEQSLLLLCDGLVLELAERMSLNDVNKVLMQNHANLE